MIFDRTMAEEKPKANGQRCLLCQATGKLFYSHIYPDFFIRSLETQIETGTKGQKQPASIALSTRREVKGGTKQRGYWEKELGFKQMLLCQKCEVRLSQYEGYFRLCFYGKNPGALRKQPLGKVVAKDVAADQGIYEAREVVVDYRRFKLFVLSLLWRASAAKGKFFRDVYLGQQHQERLRELLANDDPGNDEDYAIMLMDLRHEGAGIEDFIEQPGWTRDDEGRRFYKLIIGGFMFIIYVIGGDQRPPEFVNSFRLQSSGKLIIGVANAKPILRWWAKRLRVAGAFPRK